MRTSCVEKMITFIIMMMMIMMWIGIILMTFLTREDQQKEWKGNYLIWIKVRFKFFVKTETSAARTESANKSFKCYQR